jgi:tetratricopeptide (TPR) repeat protein
LIACSTKKNTFLARNSHALSTEYNILYNGQIALDKGLKSIETNSKDNFWFRLAIERMQIPNEFAADDKPKNADFELAEAKATKAIQKHSMNIGGREKNTQIDEAYLLLGKARYYDQRFIPALDAFNYILYKYPNSSKIYEAKIWREKTNMRLGNDEQVIKNITKLLDEKKLKNQVVANANALLSEAFLNLEEKDSAVAKLKIAEHFTKINAERARYRFILGQLYQELGKKDSAIYCYESVIQMKRKAERNFTVQAYAKKAQLFDFQKGDTTAFLKTFNALVKDRENRPFIDIIFYEMGVFYDKNDIQKSALHFYNASLKKAPKDAYLVASNYRNMGDMYFRNTEYQKAGKYYDSTMTKLDVKTREYIYIQKTRKNLDEVIEFEAISKRNDSILNVVSLNEAGRISYYENYISKLKKEDSLKKIAAEKLKTKLENIERNTKTGPVDQAMSFPGQGKPSNSGSGPGIMPPSMQDPASNSVASVFYFYNPSTVAFGKIEFKKRWGDRSLGSNWRLSTNTMMDSKGIANDTLTAENKEVKEEATKDKIPENYTADFYIKKLPKTQIEIDSISKERNKIDYQLGVIYKEKFKKNELATKKLEGLLTHNPEEKLVLPSMYNLFKIYQITDNAKADAMKSRILSQYPNSRYAQIINNIGATVSTVETPEKVYDKWFKLYEEEQFNTVLENIDELILQFSGDEIVSKFELLKAFTIGKVRGLEAYKKAIQNVADNFPNSEEGKKAQEILTTQIPSLEKIDFSTKDSNSWKILFKVPENQDQKTKILEEKINKFIVNEKNKVLSYSCEKYTDKENIISIQGIISIEYAKGIVEKLKEIYKVLEPSIIITNENYKVIQIKKNLEYYPAPVKP